MDFAKKYLANYGWKEGSGLGKNEDGIQKALKPALKNDTKGMGFMPSNELKDAWWAAPSLVNAKVKQVKNQIGQIDGQNCGDKYAGLFKVAAKKEFESSSKVDESNIEQLPDDPEDAASNVELETKKKKKKGKKRKSAPQDSDEEDSAAKKSASNHLDFDQLFKKFDGRTCHKAARFGLKMSGKLARLEAQERNFTTKCKT